MIHLHSLTAGSLHCVRDHTPLEVWGWHIPGMRCLAELVCSSCGQRYFADLPVGQALASPMLLDVRTGCVFDATLLRPASDWFAEWLHRGYAERISKSVDWSVECFRPLKRPLLLNCLNALYGHSLLALLNAQYYIDHCPEWDLIVLVPHHLRWLVPAGVAEIWSLPWSFRQGFVWNDGLATQIRERLVCYDECALSIALPHPHPDDWNIQRFTGIEPFRPRHSSELTQPPTVTFVWRDDRLWVLATFKNRPGRLLRRLAERANLVHCFQLIQQDRFVTIAKALRQSYPTLDVAIVGLGRSQPGLPRWIQDQRTTRVDEETERSWCARYARSHVVVGVHGSNMLLPSAHAGAVVELLPPDRATNLMQDILLPEPDARRFAARCRFLPWETSPQTVAETIKSVLAIPDWMKLCGPRQKRSMTEASAHTAPTPHVPSTLCSH